MIPISDPRFVKYPIEDMLIPKTGARVICNSWWEVIDGCFLGWKGYGPKSKFPASPQCNTNKNIVDKVKHPECEAVYYPSVFWFEDDYDYDI